MDKKIAFVSDAIWPYNKGGKEKRLYDISTRLSQKGHNVHIYTMKWWKGGIVKKENGITLHAISKLYPLYSGGRRSIKQGILFGLSCFKLLKEDWDVIDVDSMPFFPLYSLKLVSLLKNRKMYATWHEVWGKNYWKDYLGKLGTAAYFIEKTSVSLPDKIISVSGHTTYRIENQSFLIKSAPVTIPDGIDFERIQKVRPAHQKSDIIYVGRLLSHKNINILIKSIAVLKNWNPKIKCLIIGDGPEKKNLEKLVRKLDLSKNILFLGFVENHDKVISLMKSSNVFVLPSTREGFGIVALESNACGIPVITVGHKDNAAKDLIKGNNGDVVRLDEKEIAESVIRLSKRVSSIGCINFAKEYDWNNILKQIELVYQL